MIINNNIPALNTYRQMGANQLGAQKSMEKLASGLRINRAGDDAAGLAISEKMRAQIRGLDQASRNAQDGISLIQTTEGALQETHNILQRMRELATQAANDTNANVDREEIQKEMNQLTSEINRIGNTTEFNTKTLLNGDFEKIEATTANINGTSVGASVTINGVATSGSATGAALSTPLEIHSGKGANVSGSVNIDDTSLASSNVVIGAANNELTLTVDGVQKTLTLTAKTYDGTAVSQKSADLIADINAQLDSMFGANVATASMDANNKLVISSDKYSSTSSVTIDGGNAAATLFGANWSTTDTIENGPTAANNTMDITLDGVTKTITLANKNYDGTSGKTLTDLASDIQTQVDTVFGGGKLTVTKTADDKLKFDSQSTGSDSSVRFSGAAVSDLGLSSASFTDGTDDDTSFDITVDGEAVNVTLAAGTTDLNVFAAQLQNSINSATSTAADVTVSVKDGGLVITSGTEGSGGSISVTDNGAAASTGLSVNGGAEVTSGQDEANADLKFQIGANNGQFMSISISDMRSQALGISGTESAGSQGTVAGAVFTSSQDVTDGTSNAGSEYALDVSTHEKASAAVEVLNNAIERVSAERSTLGAFQNRLEHTISNLNNSSENLQAAESRIRDVDMAREVMDMTKNNILAQASQAMLAQANQAPQAVLQLLG